MTRSPRVATISRKTHETSIDIEVNLDGTGQVDVKTGIGFYDHMLNQLGKHGLFDLKVHVEGDLWIDGHHTMKDTAIALGQAFDQALTDRRGVRRFADRLCPLDDAALPRRRRPLGPSVLRVYRTRWPCPDGRGVRHEHERAHLGVFRVQRPDDAPRRHVAWAQRHHVIESQ